jgi:hypothetical protein
LKKRPALKPVVAKPSSTEKAPEPKKKVKVAPTKIEEPKKPSPMLKKPMAAPIKKAGGGGGLAASLAKIKS